MHKRSIRVAMGLAVVMAALTPATAAWAVSYLYKSTPATLPAVFGNIPSFGEEAYAFNELGQQITLSAAGKVRHVVVTMSSWACESGTWHTGDCATTPGDKFNVPIAFSIYNAANGDEPTVAGSLIAKITKTFAIPYRPSANYTHCNAGNGNAGKWWGGTPKKCFNGKAVNITFAFGAINLPQNVVFGISYNTTHYGYAPIGESATCFSTTQGCFYDSLNIGVTQAPTDVTAGSNSGPDGTVFVDSPIAGGYCDGGADGLNVFREDSDDSGSGCWSVGSPNTPPTYTPAVQLETSP